MFHCQIAHDHKEAVAFDECNGNAKWQDCTKLEMDQLFKCDTFKDRGRKVPASNGHKMAQIHLVCGIEHNKRHKVHMVVDGDPPPVPIDSICCGVASSCGLLPMSFVAELNGLDNWATNVGNACLEATTKEKFCVSAGPEFGECEGHALFARALCGLQISELSQCERLADCSRAMGFTPHGAEHEV